MACISSRIATVIQVTFGAIKGTITDLMSHSQFHCTGRVYLDLHGLIFETSICYWQDQPGSPRVWGPASFQKRNPFFPFSLFLRGGNRSGPEGAEGGRSSERSLRRSRFPPGGGPPGSAEKKAAPGPAGPPGGESLWVPPPEGARRWELGFFVCVLLPSASAPRETERTGALRVSLPSLRAPLNGRV